jgi:hypothetical protein
LTGTALQHHLTKIALHGRLHLAPVKEEDLKRILDFGTGTGSWAIEMGNLSLSQQQISKLTLIQPKSTQESKSSAVISAPSNQICTTSSSVAPLLKRLGFLN